MQQTPIATMNIHHLGLTVPDAHAARDFFVAALEFGQVAERRKPLRPSQLSMILQVTIWIIRRFTEVNNKPNSAWVCVRKLSRGRARSFAHFYRISIKRSSHNSRT